MRGFMLVVEIGGVGKTMGTFVAEAGADVSVGGEKAKSGERNYRSMEGEVVGVRASPVRAELDGKSVAECQRVDGSQDWDQPDCVLPKSNGNPDSQICENGGDGDLPSFSIKRLRRLPQRVSPDQQPGTTARAEPSGIIAADRTQPRDERGGEGAAAGNNATVADAPLSEAGSGVADEDKPERRQALPDTARAVGAAAHSADDSTKLPQQEQEQRLPDLSTSKEDVLEERSASPVVQNGEIRSREPEVENGKHAIEEEAEVRNPGSGGSGIADKSLSPGHLTVDELPSEREKHTGNGSGQEISEGNKEDDNVVVVGAAAAPDRVLNSANTLIGETHESHIPGSNSGHEHTTLEHAGLELQEDNPFRENASSGTSDSPFPSAGLGGGVSDKENIKVESSAVVAEDPNRDAVTEDGDKVPEGMELVASKSPAEPAEVPAPGIVQILPPVMGSRFESPGETTDEETDSPRSSEGFAYPDSDATTLPYSGQIMYPARFSSAQTSNGPSLLHYSGSMSLRSDSSTTSNRSFAFPILAPPEWNSSPVRMAKAHPRRKNRFDGCCFFRLSRLCHKY